MINVRVLRSHSFLLLQRQRRHCRGVERVHRCVCVCVSERRGSVCVRRETAEWENVGDYCCRSCRLRAGQLYFSCFNLFFSFCFDFYNFQFVSECCCFLGFLFYFYSCGSLFFSVWGGVSNEGIALAALRLSLFSERGSRRGRHCTGDRTACLPLLLPLGW